MFQKIIKELRLSKDMRQDDLAKILNTTRSTVSDWENKRTEPSIDMLTKIADYFQCSVDYLLGRESEDGYIIIGHDSPTEQSEIERLYTQLDKYQQARVLGYIESLLNSTNNQTKNNA